MKYVIIGNGPAAVNAVEAIRKLDAEGSITLFSKEDAFTYSRPLISYLLLGRTDEQRMRYKPDDFYAKHQVDYRQGVAAVSVDTENKVVTGSDGSTAAYDKLLLATGGKPFIPPMEGLDQVKYHSFMTLEDAHALKAEITQNSRVLIIGAGLIGLKCLEGIRHMCAKVTVADMADQILPSILDKEAAAMVQKHIEKEQVEFLLGDSAVSVRPGEATMKSGRKVPFDVLVVAVGVRPATDMAVSMGLEAARGIMTDANGETAIPGVYAAGDCAVSHDITTDTDRVLALLPNASMQGEVCGTAMAGGTPAGFNSLPMNAMGMFGLHMITAGAMIGEDHIIRTAEGYKRLCTKDNRLMGYIMVGDVERAGIYTSLIREKTPLDTIDFELMLEKPQMMAFSKRDRQIRMGGSRL